MTAHELRIWLVTNHHTQITLAEALGLTPRTIGTYCRSQPPKWLKFALTGLEVKEEQDLISALHSDGSDIVSKTIVHK